MLAEFVFVLSLLVDVGMVLVQNPMVGDPSATVR
jgi:hypothetical protein